MIVEKDKDGSVKRILTETGYSVVSDNVALNAIVKMKKIPDHYKLPKTSDIQQYDYKYGTDHAIDESFKISKKHPKPEIVKIRSTVTDLYDRIEKVPTGISEEAHKERLVKEIQFFVNNGYIDFLLSIMDLIDDLNNDNVVYSGRGSSCASYVFFLLGLHNINPIVYDIDFKEFSKEK